ncbi:unnamed protein product [Boreogadus saida]
MSKDIVESTATSPPHLSRMLLHPRHLFHHPRHPFQEKSAREQARHEESEANVSVASLARPGQFGHLGEVCCYGTGRYGTDANEPTRAHARLRNLSWMTYSQCDDHGHNKGDEPSFPLNDNAKGSVLSRKTLSLERRLYEKCAEVHGNTHKW